MRWRDTSDIAVPDQVVEAVGGHKLIASVLAQRGLRTAAEVRGFLDPACYHPRSALEVPDMIVAAERLRFALQKGEQILVWGDFDADGLTATALLVEALTELGGRVAWHIPDRMSEGHGVQWSALQPFLDGGTNLVVTCDTGVSSVDALNLAQQSGTDVIITDHHELPETLPSVTAIVTPKRLEPGHALYNLSGVGVAYQLAQAVGAGAGGLDLVALGMVADVVPLVDDCRYLVQRGLQELAEPKRIGLRAMIESADIGRGPITEEEIGYVLAPRLNALGRLQEASAAVELLLTKDWVRARTIAAELEAMNARRQFLSRQVVAAAVELVERDLALRSRPVLVVTHSKWPPGVLGIAAARLAERYGRPTILITTPAGDLARGSARSVAGVDVLHGLAQQSHLLAGFGGHPGAAGFSLRDDLVPVLTQGLETYFDALFPGGQPEQELAIDAWVRLGDLTIAFAEQLRALAPFGMGNPAICLACEGLSVLERANVGKGKEHVRLSVEDAEGHTMNVFRWHAAHEELPVEPFSLAFKLRTAWFGGRTELSLTWVDARSTSLQEPIKVASRALTIADQRKIPDPLGALGRISASGGVEVWAEGEPSAGAAGRTRLELAAADHLVIWTTPPGMGEIREVLRRVEPTRVTVFAAGRPEDSARRVMERVAAMTKHASSSRGGEMDLDAVAAVLGHRRATVEAALRWLEAAGMITTPSFVGPRVTVAAGGVASKEAAQDAWRDLRDLVHETVAFRRQFREGSLDRLLEIA